MTEFYLDFETVGLDPTHHKIITIQFQELDTRTGNTRGPLQILKEWESSEEEILKSFIEILNTADPWNFVPIGYNLRFELFFLQVRAKKVLGHELANRWLYYDLARLDIQSVLVMINHGMFRGATLDWFTRKKASGRDVPKWYNEKDYETIEEYIADEARRFIHAYQFLKKALPPLINEYTPLP